MKSTVVSCLAVAVFTLLSTATVVSADMYSGTRSTAYSGQLVTDDAWTASTKRYTDPSGFRITFSAEQTGDLWYYTYTFKDQDGSPLDPSITRFFKLQVSSVAGATYGYISDATGNVVSLTPEYGGFHLWDAPASDPSYYMNFIMYGDDRDSTGAGELADGRITIVSSQAPMWGSFYARGSDGPSEATNQGFLDSAVWDSGLGGYTVSSGFAFDSMLSCNDPSVLAWILVPDTMTVVPVPAAVLLGLLGLGVAGMKLRRCA